MFGSAGIYSTGEDGEVPAGSLDIGLKRLAAMDVGGIDVQVLSLNQPATENLEPGLAVKLAAMANDDALVQSTLAISVFLRPMAHRWR